MTDFEIAKMNLAGHSICLCRNGNFFVDDGRGISPMMKFIAEGRDLTGYCVADLIVGKAAAMLFVKCGIKSVFAKTLSEGGKKVLDENGIFCEYETLTPRIVNRAGTDVCPMEKAVADCRNVEEAYILLKNQLKTMGIKL